MSEGLRAVVGTLIGIFELGFFTYCSIRVVKQRQEQ